MSDSDSAPSASADTTPRRHLVAREDGTRFAVTVHPAAGGPSTGGSVVLVVPAMGMPAGYYRRLATALAGTGWSTAVMEQRGHEESGGRSPGWRYDFGYADLVDDVDAAVDLLTRDGAEVYLLGHSLGGQVASAFAASHPDRLAGLILVAAPLPYWRDYHPAFLPVSQLMGLVPRVVGHFPGRQLRFAGREARGVMADWARLARTGRLAFGRPRVDHGPALARLELPALVVSVSGDTLAPPTAVDRLAAMMPALDMQRRHVEADGIDHFRWARQPESVVPSIVGWLEQRSLRQA
ncbi:MAG: alpha/beta fold hydrolase [Nocardioides sp.]|uniref:alpha/beta hydrolase family protein n=1 Tax=Nocardioides sp. TaxID=35761 RepID=UPI0039E6D073